MSQHTECSHFVIDTNDDKLKCVVCGWSYPGQFPYNPKKGKK